MTLRFTPKMQNALAHYAGNPDRDKVAAYRHAYDCSNMSDKVVAVKAYELFSHPLMAAAIQSITARAIQKIAVDSEWVLRRAALLADFNISRFIRKQDDGTAVYDFSNATDDDWYCIEEYTVDTITKGRGDDRYEVERVKLKASSKIAALRLVGEHTKVQAFNQNISVNANVATTQLSPDEFKQARREMLRDDDC